MKSREERLREQAILAGINAAQRRGRALDEEELRRVRVQTMRPLHRGILLALGAVFGGVAVLLAVFAPQAYPWTWLVVIGAGVCLSFGLLGIRRSLGRVAETLDAADLVGSVLLAVGSLFD